MLNNYKIGLKLVAGMGLLLLIIIGIVVFNYTQFVSLGNLQDAGAKRAADAITVGQALKEPPHLYRVIADTELNLDFEASRTAWTAEKQETGDLLDAVDKAVDTDNERAWAKQVRAAYGEIVALYEDKMLPALIVAKGTTTQTTKWDAEMNGLVTKMSDPLNSIMESLDAESVAGDQTYDAAKNNVISIGWFVLAGALILGVTVAVVLTRNITGNVNIVTSAAQGLASGNLKQRADVQGVDETAIMAKAFNSMAERLEEMVGSEQKQSAYLQSTVEQYASFMSEVGTGNLTKRLTINANGHGTEDPMIILGTRLNEMVASFRIMISQIRDAATNLGSAAAEILAATTQQASGASEQSAAVTETTTTVDEVKTISEQVVQRAREVTDSSKRTVEVSEAGQKSVQETIDSMYQIKEKVEGIAENILALSEKTQQIGEIISTVSDIASQSNMLALNASIEAARAGEHGKGFAVVANEVRNLAEQSKAATAQVSAILSEIQNATNTTVMVTEEGTKGVDRGVKLAAQAQEAIEKLTDVIRESSQAAMQVMAGGQQQATGIEQISLAMKNINQVTVQSMASTRQAEKSAQNLNELSRQLTVTVATYQA